MVKGEWISLAKKLKSVYPKIFAEQTELTAWFDALKEYDTTAVATAIDKWVVGNKWQPKINEIINLIPIRTEYDWTMICEIYKDCGEKDYLPSKEEYLSRFTEKERRELLERFSQTERNRDDNSKGEGWR